MKAPRINSKGLNTSCVMGFCNTLNEILTKEKPTHIAVAFDHGKTFRHEAFPAYKAQREETPEDIKLSVPIIKNILEAYHIPILQVDGFEADDIIGTVALKAGEMGIETYMLTPGYFARLRNEYLYLSHKFSLQPMDYKLWRFLRLRPQNFPHIRISQLANLYYNRRAGLSQLLEASTVKEAKKVLATSVTGYWETHYTFGSTSIRNEKHLSPFSLNLLIINTVVPILFAYGRHRGEEKYCDRAFDFLEELKAENNHIVRMWQQCGLEVENAGDSQALIQLKKEYCDKKECLRCRIGYEYLKR